MSAHYRSKLKSNSEDGAKIKLTQSFLWCSGDFSNNAYSEFIEESMALKNSSALLFHVSHSTSLCILKEMGIPVLYNLKTWRPTRATPAKNWMQCLFQTLAVSTASIYREYFVMSNRFD
ncbi:Fibin [Columba guinea]|nr:Fibin [Columba guinea]